MTDFFKQIEPLVQGADLQMTIRKKGDQLTVSILAKGKTKDEAATQIAPLVISGTADELDAELITAIKTPIEKTTGILVNMAEYEKAQAKAEAESKQQRDAQAEKEKAKKERKEKFDKMVKKADEFEKAKNYREAISTLNKAKELTDKPEEIQKRIKGLTDKLTGGGLFAEESTMETTSSETTETEEMDEEEEDLNEEESDDEDIEKGEEE